MNIYLPSSFWEVVPSPSRCDLLRFVVVLPSASFVARPSSAFFGWRGRSFLWNEMKMH